MNFHNVWSKLWVKSAAAGSLRYTTTDGSLFTEIVCFPSGFTGPFVVSVGETILGTYSAGDQLVFPNGGVSEFTINVVKLRTGTNGDPSLLPLQIAFDHSAADFSVNIGHFLPGDFNRDDHVDASDIAPMIEALVDPSDYKTTYDPNLSDDQMQLIGDVDGDGQFTNGDLQALLDLINSGGGSTDPVPEPASLVLLAFGALFMLSRRTSPGGSLLAD